jgi:multiple sugar transport system ATP-binding protein
VQTRLEIAKLQRQLGATIVYVTHDQVEAMTLGDCIVVMNEGQIQQTGSPLELYQQPKNLFVATFIGSPKMNLLAGEIAAITADGVQIGLISGERICATVATENLRIGQSVTVGLRAEHLLEPTAEGQRGSEQLHGTVALVEHLGEANFIYLTLKHSQEIVVRGDGNRSVAIGSTMTVSTTPEAFHVFTADGLAVPRLVPGNLLSSRQTPLPS